MLESINRTGKSTLRTRGRLVLAAAVAATLGVASATRAATVYWDDNGGTAGGGGATAAGTWGSSNFWSTSATGNVATVGWDLDTSGDDIAVFSAGTDVTGNYTVTVSGTQTASRINFEESGGTGVNSGVNMTGGAITLSGATPTISIGSGAAAANVRFLTPITAANELTITSGTTAQAVLQLGPAAANTLSGGVRIAGRVRINANQPGALGTGTITVTASGAGIATLNDTTLTAADINITNNIFMDTGVTGFSIGAGRQPTGVISFSGNISGNGNLFWEADPFSNGSNGNGLLVVSGTNTYTGTTYVNHSPTTGVVRLGSAGALPTNTRWFWGHEKVGGGVENGGDVDLNGNNVQISSLESNLPAAGAVIHGITNSNGSTGGGITITGGVTSTYNRAIGSLPTVTNANYLPSKTNNVSLTLASSHTGNLTLSMPNDYAGATTVSGGTLTIAPSIAGTGLSGSAVTVNSGGTLRILNTVVSTVGVSQPIAVNSGGTLTVSNGSGLVGASNTVTVANGGKLTSTGTNAAITGAVSIASGGEILPGGTGGIGKLRMDAGLTLNGTALPALADATFDLVSPTSFDAINLNGSTLTLNGANLFNIAGTPSTSMIGTYTLATFGGIVGGGTIAKGTDPGGDFTYTLTTGANAVTLQVLPVNPTLLWDAGSGGTPVTDGAGNWADASPNFVDLSASPSPVQINYNNAGTADVIFGGGDSPNTFGGVITLTGNVRAGGKLIFGPVDATTPYTIGDGVSPNTLTTVGGIVANTSATIAAPIVMDASQEWKVNSGTLTVSGNVSDGSGGPATLTKIGSGNLTLSGAASSFSGGLIVTAGRVDVSSGGALGTGPISLPSTQLRYIASMSVANALSVDGTGGTVNVNNAAFNVTMSGNITGTARLLKEGAGNLHLTGTNTYNGLYIGNGTLYVDNDSALGSGSIELNGGGIGAGTSSWSTSKNILLSGANTDANFRTNGQNITVSGVISGTGDLVKFDTGALVLNSNNTYTGNTVINSGSPDAGIIRTNAATALSTGNNIQVNSPVVLDTLADLTTGPVRATSQITKSGPGTWTVTGSATTTSTGGSLIVNQGKVVMSSITALGGTNNTGPSAALDITLNPGTEFIANWQDPAIRRGGSFILNNATFTRPDQVSNSTTTETEFATFESGTNYGDSMTVSGVSLLQSLDTGLDGFRSNTIINMPITLTAGATLTVHSAAVAAFNINPLTLQGDTTFSTPLTMSAGSTLITTGTGEARIGGTGVGKPIIAQGSPGNETTLKLGDHAYVSDVPSLFTTLTVNGSGDAGLRIEARMNATYVDRSVDTSLITDGITGLFGINTTNTQVGGTPPPTFTVVGNSYTVLSPKRVNGLTGSGGTLTVAAIDATDATGRLSNGPDVATNVRLAFDNTATSAGANLTYEIDGNADAQNLINFAGLDVKRTNAGAGSVKVKLVNSVTRVPDVTITGGTKLDVNDQKLALTNMSAGSFDGSNYTGVHKLVKDGRNSTAVTAPWNGSGIITSQTDAIAPSSVTGLAVATASDVGKSTFGGVNVNPSDALVMYTYTGDANLSGNIDADDYFQIDSNYNKPSVGMTYNKGDFNYDGVINGDDFFMIDQSFISQGPPIAGGAIAGGVTAVPEPGAATLAALALAPLLKRRRRRC